MAIIDFINKFKTQKENKKYAAMLNGYLPVFSQFGTDIYASDVVQQAIACIVQEMKKLSPQHIREVDSDLIPINDSLQRLLDEPNERMTQSDFIEKVYWQLFLNYNSFIIPTYDVSFDKEGNQVKNYTGLYPIQPINVDILQDPSGALFYRFKFINDYETTLRMSDVIHLKYRYSVNEFMGGNEAGQPDNKALLKTLELNNTLLQGVAKALKSSFAINGVIKYNTLLDDGKMDKNIKDIENHLKNNESGFLPLDIKGEFIPLQNKIQLVDSTTLKFIDEKILRHFGVSLPILTGDYTKAQYEAFYQKTLEHLVKGISEEFTKKLFTPREKGFGNKIKFYPHELIFMDTSQKIELFDILVDSASCYQNELRVAFGMRPLPELAGKIAQSSNKTNAENNKDDNNSSSTKNKDDDTQSDTQNNKDTDNRSIYIENIENVYRYNPNHGKDGKFAPGGGGGSGSSGGSSGGSSSGGSSGDVSKMSDKDLKNKQEELQVKFQEANGFSERIAIKKELNAVEDEIYDRDMKAWDEHNKTSVSSITQKMKDDNFEEKVKSKIKTEDEERNEIRKSITNKTEKDMQNESDNTYKKISSSQKEALDYYTMDGYYDTNEYLKGNYDDMPNGKALIKDIDSAMSQYKLKEDVTLYRGVNKKALENLSIGDSYSDKGYLSTSVNEKIGKKYAEDQGSEGALIKIKASSDKTNGIYIGVNSASYYDEAEFLMGRDSKMKVTNIKTENGIKVYEMEVE